MAWWIPLVLWFVGGVGLTLAFLKTWLALDDRRHRGN